jgi:hypothetical protein
LIGTKGEDLPKMLAHFGRAVNFLRSLFNVLREIAICGDPAGAAEEAPQSPSGKRSLSWKSTAILPQTLCSSKKTNLRKQSFLLKNTDSD